MKSAPLQSSKRRFPLSTPSRAQGKPSRAVAAPALSHPIIQARLRISSPNDRSELEADQVADQVVRMAAPEVELGSVQRQFTACMGSARCPNWVDEARRSPAEEEGEVQTKQESGRTPTVRPRIQAQIHSLRGGGQPLGPATRAFMEPRFGQDFGNVRIHQGPTAETAAASLHARAFTLGCDVVFAAGEHDPKSEGGKRLLAHELTHVVQQRGSVRAGSIQREEGSGASLAPPFRRGLGMRAPYRLEIGDPRSDTSVHSSWYTLLPSIVGISMDAFTQRYPAVDDSWYKRLVELGLTVGWQVPWMVLSHEYGHYRVGEREGWDPDVSLTSWYSGVTEYTNRAAYAAAPESAQIEASAAGVNQERLNSMRMFIDWALNNSIDPHEAFAFLASRTNMALYAARSSVGGGTGGKDDLLAYQSRTGTSTEKVLVLAAASDLLSASTWGAFIPIFSRFLARGERRFEIPSVELGGVRTTWPNFHVLLGTEGPIVGAQAVVGVDRPMPVEITIDTGIDEFAFALGAKVHGVPLADRLTASPFLRATIADPPGVVVGTDLRYDLSRTLSITGTLEYRRNDLLAEPTGKREGLGGSLSVGISLP